jgi:DNA-binding transcriptional MerR regulator
MATRGRRHPLMTVGELARRTGLPAKAVRQYHDLELIYSAGRSPTNYRLFDDAALWCVEVIRTLRSLGLTVAEIREVAEVYLHRPDQPVGPYLAQRLRTARQRTERRIAELQQVQRRIDAFEASHAAELAGSTADFRAHDPRAGARGA